MITDKDVLYYAQEYYIGALRKLFTDAKPKLEATLKNRWAVDLVAKLLPDLKGSTDASLDYSKDTLKKDISDLIRSESDLNLLPKKVLNPILNC